MPIDTYQGLWREFAIESGEYLDRIEPLLVGAEANGIVAADTVATLFRGMHSIKGMAAALALRGMERVAHHAEHVLGQVRDGRCRFDSSLVSVLLEALDELKRLRAIAVAREADAPVAETVMARLEHTRAALEGLLVRGSGDVVVATAAADEPPPLHPDREALVGYVAALCPVLPELAQLVGSGLETPAVRATIRHALRVVCSGADGLGFTQVSRTAMGLADLIPAEGNLGYEARERAIDGLARLRREVATLETATGCDGGGQALDDSLKAALSLDYTARRRALLDLLGGYDRESDRFAPGGAAIRRATELAGDIYDHFSFLYNANAGRLLLMIENVLGHAAEGDLVLTPELMGLVRRTLAELAPVRGAPPRDLDAAAAEAVVAFETAIRAATTAAATSPGGEGTQEAQTQDAQDEEDRLWLAGLAVTSDVLDRLTLAQRRDVAEQVRSGTVRLWEIVTTLEEAEDKAERFAAWLQNGPRLLTSCAVAGTTKLSFRLLVMTVTDDTAVLAALAAIDPDGSVLTARRCGAPPVLAVTAREGTAPADGSAPVAEPLPHRMLPTATGTLLRVPGEAVDHFLAVIGEMVMTAGLLDDAVWGDDRRGRLALDLRHLIRDMRSHGGADPGHLEALQRYASAQDGRNRSLRKARDRLAASLGRLQEAALELRVVPVETVFASLPRLARDLAASRGKEVRVEVDGGDTRIDKGMVDQLLTPLIHMVRNAIDHGIETPAERLAAGKPVTATLSVRADQRENGVVIEVTDDGRGLDAEAIRLRAVERQLMSEGASRLMPEADLFRLILLPGFSIAETVTETSGRGVGMDVVHNSVTRLGGLIDIRSRPGQGVTFTLRLPLSAAIQDVLMVEVDGRLYALPVRHLLELSLANSGSIQIVHGQPAMLLHGTLLPLYRLTALLEGGIGRGLVVADGPIVVLGFGGRRLGVQVDRVVRRQELFVRDIHPRIASIPGIGGAAVLGDGRVVLIIDGGDLLQLAQSRGRVAPPIRLEPGS